MADHIKYMLGKDLNPVFRICWKYISPMLILVNNCSCRHHHYTIITLTRLRFLIILLILGFYLIWFIPSFILGKCCFFQVILVFSFVRYTPVVYAGKAYPVWADVIGWLMTLASNLPIVVVAVYMLCTAKGSTFRQVIYYLFEKIPM